MFYIKILNEKLAHTKKKKRVFSLFIFYFGKKRIGAKQKTGDQKQQVENSHLSKFFSRLFEHGQRRESEFLNSEDRAPFERIWGLRGMRCGAPPHPPAKHKNNNEYH